MTGSSAPTAAERRVLELIDQTEIVALATALLAAPGENPPGGEAATAAVLAAAAADLALAVESVPVQPDRPNLMIRLPGGNGPGLLLLGHTDVVPIGEGWTVPPLGGVQRDGRLYGRGSADMKGGLAACLLAMSALRRAEVRLSGPIELAAVIDEEETGLGIQHYLDRYSADSDRPTFVGCVVAEPTDLQTVVAARGAAYLEVRVTGKAAHSGNPADGRNAIYGAAAVISELEHWHAELADAAHPLVGPATWSVGLVSGGTGASIVPAECSLVVDRRMLPAESPATVLQAARERVAALELSRRGLTVEVTMTMDMPGFETDADDPFVTTADTALTGAGGPGSPLGGWTAACDGGYVARDTGMPVIVLGPGSVAGQAHRADESVAVDQLLIAARGYALMAMRLLGK
jgi:acetylornithine deacetylase/succinyl-diaminopimelate desuccinylase family protein